MMKVLAALFALLFATSAQAALYSFDFVARFERQEFELIDIECYSVDDGQGNEDYVCPQAQNTQITPGDNYYNLSTSSGALMFDSLRDGKGYRGSLVFDSEQLFPTKCEIGGIACHLPGRPLNKGLFLDNLAEGDMVPFFGDLGAYGYQWEFNPDGTGTLVDYSLDAEMTGIDPVSGQPAYARGTAMYFNLSPIPPVPVPASAFLLLGALGLLRVVRRA